MSAAAATAAWTLISYSQQRMESGSYCDPSMTDVAVIPTWLMLLWSQHDCCYCDPNITDVAVIPTWLLLLWSQHHWCCCDPNMTAVAVIPTSLMLLWSQHDCCCCDPNMTDVAVIPTWLLLLWSQHDCCCCDPNITDVAVIPTSGLCEQCSSLSQYTCAFFFFCSVQLQLFEDLGQWPCLGVLGSWLGPSGLYLVFTLWVFIFLPMKSTTVASAMLLTLH